MNALLTLWVAVISADRIDLFGGHGPFILTPFIALTPFVLVSETVRRFRTAHAVSVPTTGVGYVVLCAALLSVVLGSVLIAPDTTVSASRATLLIAQVTCTFAIAVLSSDRDDLLSVLARGAMLSLVLFAIFDVLEVEWWVGRLSETIHIGPAQIKFGDLQHAGAIPRLAGPVSDGNRSGLALLFCLAVIATGERRTWLRRVALFATVVFLVVTGSRSTALGAAGLVTGILLLRPVRPSKRVLFTAALAVAAASALVLSRPNLPGRVVRYLVYSDLASRLSTSEVSGQSHVELLQRGLSTGTSSIPHALFGLGYGSAFWYLQDIFPGNRYGNYHSIYVTMFAEAGIFALLLILAIMCTPLLLPGPAPWRELIAAAMLFNLFYQSTAEPLFWFVLALAWLTMRIPAPQVHGFMVKTTES